MSQIHYCTGDVVYLIPLEKTIPGIPIDVVAVNYAVFAISNFINYYLMYLYFMSNIAGKEKIFE